MDNATLKRKLNDFVALGNELDAEAKRRFGRTGWMFHEADGGVYIMDGDSSGSTAERQKHIKFRAEALSARWGAGAW